MECTIITTTCKQNKNSPFYFCILTFVVKNDNRWTSEIGHGRRGRERPKPATGKKVYMGRWDGVGPVDRRPRSHVT